MIQLLRERLWTKTESRGKPSALDLWIMVRPGSRASIPPRCGASVLEVEVDHDDIRLARTV
ncbi:hypothetical protein ACFFSY_07595 [Paenibacillus aurantiacus]|uniref:Uncharacterized protein n=1 Tax=Paenibacillus aurantiacus TaxID=1936118 RepID=A0ABV5KNH9_9BACL